MTYNAERLFAELRAAGCRVIGCASDGRVDYGPDADESDRVKAAQVLAGHDASPTREQRLRARGFGHWQAALVLVTKYGEAAPEWARTELDRVATVIEEAAR